MMVIPNKEQPKWEKYEELVASIQKTLTPKAIVTRSDTITGKSGVIRKIDVSIRYNLGQFKLLFVIDCKDWSKPVDIGEVGTFADLLEDVSANKGAIVCNAGFTEGAKKRATEKGIDLLMAVDAESMEWPVYISMPTLCDFRYMKNYNLCFSYSGPGPFEIPAIDPRYIPLYSKDGKLIDIVINLLIKAWNAGRLNSEPGDYEGVKFIEEAVYTKVDDHIYGPVDITANISVGQNLFFGQTPIKKAQGFKKELTGAFVTKSMESDKIIAAEVEKNWTKIENKDELAVEPVMTIVALDAYPVINYKEN